MAAVAPLGLLRLVQKGFRLLGFTMGFTLWLLSIALIVGITTMPWSNYVGHPHWDQVRWIPFYPPLAFLDILGNVVLFLPFGYFFPRALRGSSSGRSWGLPVLLATALSTAVELFQVYTHNRMPATTDICTNLLGAMSGLAIHRSYDSGQNL
jgi:glycopeptide antibiotics resistance protein